MSHKNTELEKALREWTAVPFPDDSDDDELSDIHADLALYDNDVAGYVSSLLGGMVNPLSWLDDDYGLEQRLLSILAGDDAARHKDAEVYYAYLKGLKKLGALAKQYTSA
jgi:hypothetical protein